MAALTLNEKSYLMDRLVKYFPERSSDELWEIAGAFTRPQRGKFLHHYFEKEHDIAKEMAENIKTFQTLITKN